MSHKIAQLSLDFAVIASMCVAEGGATHGRPTTE